MSIAREFLRRSGRTDAIAASSRRFATAMVRWGARLTAIELDPRPVGDLARRLEPVDAAGSCGAPRHPRSSTERS
jgi:hypothetical protein